MTEESYVPLHGDGGLYGPVTNTDKGDRRRGWGEDHCVQWLDPVDENAEQYLRTLDGEIQTVPCKRADHRQTVLRRNVEVLKGSP